MSDRRLDAGEAEVAGFQAEWESDGERADLYLGEVWIGTLRRREDWFAERARLPEPGWVVEWRSQVPGWPVGQALVEPGLGPASDDVRRADLARRARALIEAPDEPPSDPFAIPSTDLASSRGLRDRIEAISHALQAAEHRLDEAAKITEEWGGVRVLVALSETLAWLRVLDEVLRFTWRRVVDPALREAQSLRIDAALRGLAGGPGCGAKFRFLGVP